MKRLMLILGLSAVLLAASQSMAARCGGLVPNWFVFCDDFDRYCTAPPADPQEACNCETDVPDAAMLEAVWTSLPKIGSGASQTHTLRSYYFHGNEESWKCHSGAKQGYGLRVYQADANGIRGMRSERDLSAEILANPANTAGFGYVNGSGEISVPLNMDNTVPSNYIDSMSSSLRPGALKGTMMMKFYGQAHFSNMVNYVELFADDDRAPFDWVMQYCTGGHYLTHPRLIRAGDGQVHKSFAIGVVAIYDSNPCDVDTGRQPTHWRLVVFDGLQWQELKAPNFDIPLTSPADEGDLFPADGWNTLKFAIGADHIEVRLSNSQSTERYNTSRIPNPYFVARVPRQYKGPFNKIAIGPNHGMDMTTPTCEWIKNSSNQIEHRCNGGENHLGLCATADDCPVATTPVSPIIKAGADMMMEEMALYDGVFDGLPAACCKADMTCSVVGPQECEALGGVFHPNATSCDPSPCCPVPFADDDGDGDVDMDDFAALQRCLNIGSGGPSTLGEGCGCFDTNNNGVIDADDVANFAECGTGSDVQWTPTVDCPSPLP